MALLLQIVSSILLVFLILLFARFVVDWVMVLARSWRPSGLVAAGPVDLCIGRIHFRRILVQQPATGRAHLDTSSVPS